MSTDLAALIQDLARQISEARKAEEHIVHCVAAPAGFTLLCQALLYREGHAQIPSEVSDGFRLTVGMITTVCTCPRIPSRP